MKRTIVISAVLAVVALMLASGCTGGAKSTDGSKPATDQPAAGGTSAAPGLSKLDDGRTQAIGTVTRSDLEGGFWYLRAGTGTTKEEQNKAVVVIANGDKFEQRLKDLEGKQVLAIGKQLDGASTRMAGPEMEITQIEVTVQGSGAAE